ncbi:MAG TPA: hypothetical protein VI757_14085 [Bacteroidia bacterium]|nr:hypothetical protein [Bacteroidia bacterium]
MLRHLFFLLLFLVATKIKSQPFPSQLNLSRQLPDSFIVEFKTTKENFSITARC